MVHMVEIFEIAFGTLWKSNRRSWMRRAEEVKLHLPKTSGMIYML